MTPEYREFISSCREFLSVDVYHKILTANPDTPEKLYGIIERNSKNVNVNVPVETINAVLNSDSLEEARDKIVT